jgi:hypothetical protein
MKRRALGLAMIAAVLVSLSVSVAVAQDKPATPPAPATPDKPAAAQDKSADKPADNLDVLRDKLRADKRLVVAEALALTEKEAQAFWPVYNAYQSDMVAHYDRIFKLLDTYAASYKTMTDPIATQLLGEFMAIQTNYLNIITSYVPRFQKVLPPRKVARLYQLENKIRALVDYQFAQDVPLIK